MDDMPNDVPINAPHDALEGVHGGWLAARVLLALVAILALVGAFVGVAVLNRVNDPLANEISDVLDAAGVIKVSRFKMTL